MLTEVVFSQEFVVATVQMTPAGKARRDKLLSEGKCLGCEKKLPQDEQVRAGQCECCYTAMLRAEKAGKVKRASLIREGKALPRAKGGPKPSNPFTQELAEL